MLDCTMCMKPATFPCKGPFLLLGLFCQQRTLRRYCAVCICCLSALGVYPCLYFRCIPLLFISFRIIVDS